MKKALFFPALAAAAMLAVSCASVPKNDALAENPPQDGAPESSMASALPEVGEPASSASVIDTAPESAPATETEEPELAVPVSPAPEVSELPPQPGRGDTLITFYPEPDLLVPDALGASQTPAPAAKLSEQKAAETKPADTKPAEQKAAETKAPPASPDPAASLGDSGIWTSEPTAPAAVPAASKTKTPSRSASLAVGQNLQVWYPGTGWVYLGDASALNGLGYENRKLDKKDTLFSFKALKPGTFTLEFSRYDVLSDSFSEDLLLVTVTEASGKKAETVRAPDYQTLSAVSETAAASEPVQTAPAPSASRAVAASASFDDEPSLVAGGTGQGTSGKVSPAESPDADTLLNAAKASLSKGDAAAALASLDSFFAKAVTRLDEGWFIRGQAYEANGPARNVRMALDAYSTLKKAFPDSPLWKDADARVRYIERYYLNRL